MTPAEARAVAATALTRGARADSGPPRTPAPARGSHFTVVLKPEVMAAPHAAAALAEAVRVLGREDDVAVLRCAALPAGDFTGRGYLLLHYPRLHRVAADGAAALTTGARGELGSLLERSPTPVALGAYEAMTREAGLSPGDLEERCRDAGVHKLGSGSYASVTELNGRPVTVLNGFLPALAEGYRRPGALVGLLECHGAREFAALRGELLGALHPDQADPASLRGTLSAYARENGIPLSEGRNAVHLSAGHLEGMFQAWRYFSAAEGQGLEATALGRTLAAEGTDLATVAALAADPDLTDDSGETVAPHGATEHLTRTEVVALVRQWAAAAKELAA
ncbi:hypothetical protein [Streptomyces iconiensis]|uniref:Uncharacterized protein n=1 Tax=Streptomyces iconiensis TaxID=1384038 RepID=A0ABT6ZNZ1_9ACTN|nr:hypothetical protein [Streptomyces iconiensis]MDJ1130780.1 hypothetical protein [Streptomyces iconiensis]